MSERSRKPGVESWRSAGLLVLILVVAAVVRVWKLGSLPAAIFRDEAEKGLNAWFMLESGVDASGRPWPVFIEVFGVTTSAIYQYATLPFLIFPGLNEWTVRLPAATAGVTTVLVTWMLARRVWGWQAAAWAAGLLAISPWHVPLSRWAQQGVFLPLLFVLAAWALARFLGRGGNGSFNAENGHGDGHVDGNGDGDGDGDGDGKEFAASEGGHGGWLALAGACVALAMYAYDPARLFAPLLGLAAAVVWWRVWMRRWRAVLAAAVVFLVCASPVIWLLATQGDAAQARFKFLSVFQPEVSVGEGVRAFFLNYLSHFSPLFLLLSGDEELRHSGGVGMLNIAELVAAICGGVVAFRQRCRWGIFLVLWVLLSPVAASLTRVGVPHALRSQVALPAWQLLAAVGITGVAEWLGHARRRLAYQVALLVTLVGSLPFFLSYFGAYGTRSAANWQYGVKQVLEFASAPHTKDSTVYFKYVTGAEYLVPFYLKMDRSEFVQMQRGRERVKVVPFGRTDIPPAQAAPWQNSAGPAVLVSPPGLEWPEGWVPIPINARGGEQIDPVMIMYINAQLMDRIKEQSQ